MDFLVDPLKIDGITTPKFYLIDLSWFDNIHYRRPDYEQINYVEFFILDDNNEIIDTISFYDSEIAFDNPIYRIVDEDRYNKIKKYYREENK